MMFSMTSTHSRHLFSNCLYKIRWKHSKVNCRSSNCYEKQEAFYFVEFPVMLPQKKQEYSKNVVAVKPLNSHLPLGILMISERIQYYSTHNRWTSNLFKHLHRVYLFPRHFILLLNKSYQEKFFCDVPPKNSFPLFFCLLKIAIQKHIHNNTFLVSFH